MRELGRISGMVDMNRQLGFDNSGRSRRIIQTICDLRQGSFAGWRVLDLGCAHGSYPSEVAKRGARTVGIEARADWLKHANRMKEDLRLDNVTFIQGDVRELDRRHGSFDIVLCLGLVYHLPAEDAVRLLRSIFDVCTGFL